MSIPSFSPETRESTLQNSQSSAPTGAAEAERTDRVLLQDPPSWSLRLERQARGGKRVRMVSGRWAAVARAGSPHTLLCIRAFCPPVCPRSPLALATRQGSVEERGEPARGPETEVPLSHLHNALGTAQHAWAHCPVHERQCPEEGPRAAGTSLPEALTCDNRGAQFTRNPKLKGRSWALQPRTPPASPPQPPVPGRPGSRSAGRTPRSVTEGPRHSHPPAVATWVISQHDAGMGQDTDATVPRSSRPRR